MSLPPRCCRCGFDVVCKLALVEPNGLVSDTLKDYVRVSFNFNSETDHSTLSDFVACSPGCALGYMFDHSAFQLSRVQYLIGIMMMQRHGIREAYSQSPPAKSLAYLYEWEEIGDEKENKVDDGMEKKMKSKDEKEIIPKIGLDYAAFQYLTRKPMCNEFLVTVASHMNFVPPYPDEHLALAQKKVGFLRNMNIDTIPDCIKNVSFAGIDMINPDANVDSDTETDFIADFVETTPSKK